MLALLFLTVLAVHVQPAWQQIQIGETFSGDGTYYGNQDGGGHCSFQDNSAVSFSGTGVAINAAQYGGSQACGLCVAYRGTGSGLGNSPIPTTYQYAQVTDECPECAVGSLDLATSGDGRFGIEFMPVQCATTGPVAFSFQGSNPFYTKLQVANTAVPVQSVEIQDASGNYVPLTRTSDNYFQGGGFNFPANVRITSILGDTVTDTVPGGYGSSVGTAQFTHDPSLPVSGDPASLSTAGTVAMNQTTTVNTTSPPANTTSANANATSAAANTTSAAANTTSVAANTTSSGGPINGTVPADNGTTPGAPGPVSGSTQPGVQAAFASGGLQPTAGPADTSSSDKGSPQPPPPPSPPGGIAGVAQSPPPTPSPPGGIAGVAQSPPPPPSPPGGIVGMAQSPPPPPSPPGRASYFMPPPSTDDKPSPPPSPSQSDKSPPPSPSQSDKSPPPSSPSQSDKSPPPSSPSQDDKSPPPSSPSPSPPQASPSPSPAQPSPSPSPPTNEPSPSPSPQAQAQSPPSQQNQNQAAEQQRQQVEAQQQAQQQQQAQLVEQQRQQAQSQSQSQSPPSSQGQQSPPSGKR